MWFQETGEEKLVNARDVVIVYTYHVPQQTVSSAQRWGVLKVILSWGAILVSALVH